MMEVRRFGPGVSLVEDGESGLRVLCGCPENVYKLLKRGGAIRETGEGGRSWETGPNAILLSELPVQGGRFSNLVEFPVLQMMYRQGMAIPGHPNNRGKRPLLIGLAKDLEAAAACLRSGNYGLEAVEELVAAGLSPGEAAELLRMKLSFAFGRFKGTEELLEFRTIDGPAVELRGGCFLRRLGADRYQFFRGDDRVEVDLALGPGEAYARPYELPDRPFSPARFSVVHLGEGDGWDESRPCMSSLVVHRGEAWLVDAGPHVRESLEAVGLGVDDLRGLFLTHAHDDHMVGITALLHARRRLPLLAVPAVRRNVEVKLELLAGIDAEAFRGTFEILDLVEGAWNGLDGLEVLPFFSPHPLETTCLRFRVGRGGEAKVYAHLADLSSFAVLESMVTEDPGAPGISRTRARAVRAAYLEAADLKKIDAGGGMIHGEAADFRDDDSAVILVSHRDSPPDPAALGLPRGRVAEFGEESILLPAEGDYLRERALRLLALQFPGAPPAETEVLLAGPPRPLGRGAELYPSGAAGVDLLLSGVVERSSDEGRRADFVAGCLLGEAECLGGEEGAVYRALMPVLCQPLARGAFEALVEARGLGAERRRRSEVAAFLRSCGPFSDLVSASALVELAAESVEFSYEAGERMGGPGQALHAIVEGRAGLFIGGRRIATLGPRELFGEEGVLGPFGGAFETLAETRVRACLLPAATVARMPVILWKLRELLARRLAAAHEGFDFLWRESYTVGNEVLDAQHRGLFAALRGLASDIRAEGTCPDALERVAGLRELARRHFATEEELMEGGGYPGLGEHRERHRQILAEIGKWETLLACGEEPGIEAFCDFLKDWVLRHTLSVDRAYVGRLGSPGA